MTDILHIIFDCKGNLKFFVSKELIVISIIVIVSVIVYKLLNKPRVNYYEINEAEIGVGAQKIKIKPNQNDMQIAFKLYVELSTRKIGLPIDFEHDVLIETYNSWYEFFKITRELIKDIPVTKVRDCQSTKDIIRISIDVLNNGLRPTLTKWQARYRRWYDKEVAKPENEFLTPQEIQQKFPKYNEIRDEMKIVNQNLINYKEQLKKLAIGATE